MKKTVVRILASLWLLLAGMAFAVPAHSHASLLATTPADGLLLDAAPEELVLEFNEPVEPMVLRLIAPNGETRELLGTHEVRGYSIAIPNPPVGTGTHLLTWRVVSADGHPVSGTLTFSVGEITDTPLLPGASGSSGAALEVPIWASRGILYLALFGGVAGVFFNVWVVAARRLRPSAALRILLMAGLVVAPVSLTMQGMDLLGVGWRAFFDPLVWKAAVGSTYARTLAAAFAACALALTAMSAHRRVARILSLAAFALIGVALALSGHASLAPDSLGWLMVFVHVLAVAFWTGALLPLFSLLRSSSDENLRALARFSAAIPWAIGALLVAGVLLVFLQVEAVSDLWASAYGRILAAKLGVILQLGVLAWVNRYVLTPWIGAAPENAARALRRSVALELLLVVLVFALVAGWRFTPPPRALMGAAVPAAPSEIPSDAELTVFLDGSDTLALLSIQPGRPGRVSATAALFSAPNVGLWANAVTFIWSSPQAGIEPIRRSASRTDEGLWSVEDLYLPVAGPWEVVVEISVSTFDIRVLTGVFRFAD